MKKVFIDCGYYRGRAIELFKETKEYHQNFIFHAFEPCLKKNKISPKHKDVVFHEKVVWMNDGEIDFYTSGRKEGRANGIFSNPKAVRRGMESIIKVPCIDFDKWIKDNFSKDNYIVVKMDIEGSEHDILQHMITKGSINYINLAYVEFHNKKREGYATLKNILKNTDGLELRGAIELCYDKFKKE